MLQILRAKNRKDSMLTTNVVCKEEVYLDISSDNVLDVDVGDVVQIGVTDSGCYVYSPEDDKWFGAYDAITLSEFFCSQEEFDGLLLNQEKNNGQNIKKFL